MKQILNSSLTKRILISLAIILSIVTISIGYSALNTTLNITGEVVTRVSADIRITSLETERLSDGAYNTYNSTFSKDETNMYTTLPENGSVAVYKITITNYSSNDYILSELNTNKSNTDISCIIEGISEGDIIPANSEITFTIKMLYVEVGEAIESINNVFSVKYVFEEYVPDSGGGATVTLLSDKVISDNGGKSAIETNTSNNPPDFTTVPTADNSGMYVADEGSGKTYYYRGIIDNNYVLLDNTYWRIIRVTNDNSVRMIYQGTTATASGANSTTGSKSVFISVSGSKQATAASPYKNVYGPSTAASNINTFYQNSLSSNEDKFSLTSGYCNDVTDTNGIAQVKASSIFGDVTSSVNYAAYKTRYLNNTPTFTCPENAYVYAVLGGNKTLSYPVAMITMDEVMYAGGLNAANSDYYLNSNIDYWVMTPWQYNYVIGIKTSSVFIVKADGTLNGDAVQRSHYLRPVVTLNSNTVWGGGDGTASNPYTIGEEQSSVTIDPTPYANSTLASTIQSVYEAGDTSVYYHDSNLANSAGDNSYRYSGKNPNNYVCFGSTEETCPNNNLYRIIGVIDGNVKLISADYATTSMLGTDGGYIANTSPNDDNYRGYLSNNVPTYAYNNKNGNSSNNTWGEGPLVINNLNTNLINTFSTEWQNKIVTTTWKVGNVNYFDAIYRTAQEVYNLEMGNTETYSAKVGLLYANDYGFSTSPLFWTREMNSYSNKFVKENNWLYLGLREWIISHGATLNLTNYAATIKEEANIGYELVYKGLPVRPVFSIDSSVIYTGGTGTREDPMRLS